MPIPYSFYLEILEEIIKRLIFRKNIKLDRGDV